MTQSYHYDVMRRAIALLDAADERIALADLAAQMDMSAAHFQRLFSQWVGVSPQKYQEYLRLGYAKTRLNAHHTTLDVAHDIGLSGTSRLYDLFIRWEAMTPGDYAAKGAGIDIDYAYVDTPFGEAVATATAKGLCGLGFVTQGARADALHDLAGRWPKAIYRENTARVGQIVKDAFAYRGVLDLHLIGAPFQIKVWEALLHIPDGFVSTYSDVARRVGNDRAVRAVGTAIGRNPISFFIPCHRALRKSGELGGYHWGLETKRTILAYEGARSDAKRPTKG